MNQYEAAPAKNKLSSVLVGAAPPATAVDSIGQAMTDAMILCGRVRELTGKLVGAEPEDSVEDASAFRSNGVLNDLADKSREIRSMVDRALSDIARIERQLP